MLEYRFDLGGPSAWTDQVNWAIALTLLFLLLFGPWIVFAAERTRNKWLKPLAYFCLFLGPALAALGMVNLFLSKKRGINMAEASGEPRENKKMVVKIRAEPAKEKGIRMNTQSDLNHDYDFLGQSRSTNPETTLKELDHQLKNVDPATLQEVKQAGTRRMIQDANPPAPQK